MPSPRPPPPEPPGTRQGDEGESLAGWLARDLVPKHGVRPLAPRSAPLNEAPAQRGEPFLKDLSFADPPAPRAEPFRSLLASAPSGEPSRSFSASSSSGEPFSSFPASAPSGEPFRSLAALPAKAAPFPRERPGLLDAPPPSDIPSLTEEVPASVVLATNQAPTALAPPALDDDDLAVLPGRGRSRGSRRAKLALALLLGLLLLGILLVVRLAREPGRDLEATANDRSPADNGVLLPPPPSSDPLPVAPEPAESHAARRATAARVEPEGLLDPRDPSFTREGPNMRRYADVPSPTLSRLASEQRRLARERDDAVRNAKASPRPEPHKP